MLPRQHGVHYYKFSVKMATKRPAEEPAGASLAKKPRDMIMSHLDIGPAGGDDDLNIKVIQIQNRKLSERLRERNRAREMLEERVGKLEQDQESSLRLQGALKQGFVALRECLEVAMVAVGCEGGVMGEEEVFEGSKEVEGVRRLFGSMCQCIERIAQVRRTKRTGRSEEDTSLSEEDKEEEGGDSKTAKNEEDQDTCASSDVTSRSLSLLKEMARQHRKRSQLSLDAGMWEAKCEKLEEDVAELRFQLERSQVRGDRLEVRLEATLAEVHSLSLPCQSLPPPSSSISGVRVQRQGSDGEEGGGGSGLGVDSVQEGGRAASSSTGTDATSTTVAAAGREDKTNVDEVEGLQAQLTEARELGQSRLEEAQKLSTQLAEMKKEVDGLQLSQRALPESVVKDSATYKALQAQFTIAMQEGVQLRGLLEEAKGLLMAARQQHFAQLEEIRAEEVKYQVEVREEMAGLEGALATVKRDYELLRMEYERMLASNEQAGPVAKELRVTVDSLQKSISQHKSEVGRYKTRAHKAEQQLAKLQEEKDKEEKVVPAAVVKETPSEVVKEVSEAAVEEGGRGEEEKEELRLRAELKSVEAELESYKQAASAEERDKAEILTAEKKARSQIDELKKRFEDYRRDYEKRKEHIREEASRKARSLIEDNRHLQKDLSAKKHEAQALVAEMEYTAEAFEEMQEQNIRLLQQVKEKDDANFKLMSERIKSNGIHKLLMEEKELLQSQLNAVAVERQRYAELVSGLEEREVATEATLQSVDKELALQQQASEAHRKKTQESLQAVTELQLQQTELQRQVETAQKTLTSRTDEWEKESQLHRRSVEDVSALKRKLEKYKTREWMTVGDEVLLEEIKVYKGKLNCPCCSARKKDTVLTKCFHVFCSECIRNRYDSRLRKCPKCGAAFGANDFHKIYLS